MSARDPVFDRELQEAERDVATADLALRSELVRLKAHAGKPGSYTVPLGALGALVAFKVIRRALRRRPWQSAIIGAAAPAKVGMAALLLRLAMPGILGFARQQALGWDAKGGGIASGDRPLPRVSAALDRARFSGQWFEVGRLSELRDRPTVPRGAGRSGAPVQATLVLVPVPDGYDVERVAHVQDPRRGSRMKSRSGVLRQTDPGGRASELSLSWAPSWSRWMPMVWDDYWILEVDTGYTFALIGDRRRSDLTILSRTARLDDAAWQQLLATAAEEGYPVERLERADVERD